MVAIGDEKLERQRLEVISGNARAGETVENDEKRVHLPQIAEKLRSRPGDVDHPHRRGRHLARADRCGEPVKPLVRI